jgi:hypothetical protein
MKKLMILICVALFTVILIPVSMGSGVCYDCYKDPAYGFYTCELKWIGWEHCEPIAPNICKTTGPGCIAVI